MHQYLITAVLGGNGQTVKAVSPVQALAKYAKDHFDREWIVMNTSIFNPVSGWNIEYTVEKL